MFLNYTPGQEVQLSVLRGKKKITLKAKAVARPFETDDNAEVIYDEANFRGGHLRVIINKPFKENKMPAMLFVPGYTCSSIDELTNDHPYKRIIDAYVDAGYTTMRIEKSGLGDSKNTPPCESCDLMDEIENFEVGLKKLKSLSYVDTNQIIIVGHSMGGIIVPAISAKNNAAGVVVYGTTAKSWFEYQLEMYRVQNALAGMNPIEVEQSVVEQYDLNYRYFVQKESLEEMAKDAKVDSVLRSVWGYDGKGQIYDRNAEYWRQIQDYPHLENWKNTTAKVLVQFGESDFQAFSKADHQQIVNTVNHFHPGNATLISYPSTDHYFAKSGTMQEAYDKFANGHIQQLFDEYNQEVGLSAVKWSNEILKLNSFNK
jgi:dienelactone hydrolase